MGRGVSKAGSMAIPSGSVFKDLGADTDDAYSFFGKDLDAWENGLTQAEHNAVRAYTGSAYANINDQLRFGEKNGKEQQIKDIDSAISKFDLKEDIKVYRGGAIELFGGATTVEEINAMAGTYIRDKGFVSTTTRKSVAFDNGVKFEIDVRKGKGKGAYVDGISHYGKKESSGQGESEFLVARNQHMQILGAKMINGEIVVHLEY